MLKNIPHVPVEHFDAVVHRRSIATTLNRLIGAHVTDTQDTLADMVANADYYSIGDSITIKERTTGNGGGGVWDAVDATTVTENEYNIVTGNATISFQLRIENGLINISQWGAVGYDTKSAAEGGTDSSGAIQNAWTYGRDNGVAVEHSHKKFYRTTSILKTQADGNYAINEIHGNESTIVKDYAGVGVEVKGGAAIQRIEDLRISASSSFDATDFLGTFAADVITPDFAEHGFHIVNTRVELVNCYSELNRGANVRIESTAANSNRSYYQVEHKNGGMAGVYISGTNDNISVIKAHFSSSSEYGPSFFSEKDVNIRDWDMWIYAEGGVAGASAVTDGITDQVYIGKCSFCIFKIYSENTNASVQEIRLGINTSRTQINSFRSNKDNDDSTEGTISWMAGSLLYGLGSTPVHREYRANSVTVNNAKYMDIEYVGASTRLIYRERIKGAGLVELHAFHSSTGTASGLEPYADNKEVRIKTDDNIVGKFDNSTTSGDTRFLLWDVTKGSLQRVSIGATDSGGTGFKVLRVPN